MQPLLLGLTLGLRHAVEPDHLAAITTMVAGSSPRAAARTGAAWGFGHAVAIVLLGSVVLALGVRVPPGLAMVLDLAVVAMLVVLGVQAIRSARSGESGTRAHHAHAHDHDQAKLGRTWRSTLVGFIHGASGTAAITLLCLGRFASSLGAMSFLVLFSLGALVSMSVLSALLAGPLSAIAKRGMRATRGMQLAGGVIALAAAVVVVIGALQNPGAS